MHRFLKRSRVEHQQEVSSVSGANGMAIDLLACTGDACGVGNLRALRCINHPATAYLHCMKPVAKIVGDGPKASSLLG